MTYLAFKKADPCLRRSLLFLALAAALAGCGATPTSRPLDDSCAYPGASVQCRGLNPG